MRDDTVHPSDLTRTDRVRFTGTVIGEWPPRIDLGWRDRDGRHVILEHTGGGWYRPRPVEHPTPTTAAPTTAPPPAEIPPPPHQCPAARPRQRRRPLVALHAGDSGDDGGSDPDPVPADPQPLAPIGGHP
jgi:hypothetical protein